MLAAPGTPQIDDHPAAETAVAAVTAKPRRWSRGIMHWIRRIHLYSGLFMFPWVMLYGVTALLFNHPGAFADQPRRVLTPEDFAGTPLEHPADPAADAEQVVAALNVRFRPRGSAQPPYRLVEPGKASYSRQVIHARARGAGQDHAILFDLPTGTASVATSEQTDDQPPFAVRGLKVRNALGERVKTALPAALSRQGLAADDAGIAQGAELVFFVEGEGQLWRATYNIQTGAVNGRPADSGSGLSTRRFLLRLHLAHGYPSEGWIGWLWALSVDAMFVAMVFWGISGILMWWQIKGVRGLGAAIVLISLILATLLAIGMHGSMAR